MIVEKNRSARVLITWNEASDYNSPQKSLTHSRDGWRVFGDWGCSWRGWWTTERQKVWWYRRETPYKPTFHLCCSLLISRTGRSARPAELAFSQRFERLGQLIMRLTELKLRTQILSFACCLSPQATTSSSDVAIDMALHYVARRIRSVLPITREYPIHTDFATNGIATSREVLES